MTKERFLLVDGNFLMFQSFYASLNSRGPLMQDSHGRSTNGVHVFLMTLKKVIDYVNPHYLFIAFDAFGKTKRHELYDEYKAGRTKAPEEIFDQFRYIKQILTSFNIRWFEQVGDEADDLIATLSQIDGPAKFIYSKDQDLLQLVNEETNVIYKTKAGDFDLYSLDNFEYFHQIKPHQIPDLKGLAGDSSDNIKGVAGIGPKGAINLINTYGSIESIYENIDKIKGATQKKLIDGKNDALFCKDLTKLNKCVNMDKQIDGYSIVKINVEKGLAELNNFDLAAAISKYKNLFKIIK
ncbi:5'-3' exonuclease [Mycoplasma simbae]|uniref:5'-3' exonuclease n=1 Tax=Mycoplasma simbae TaxID=36744 RepID=UPI0004951F48|nr:5'-3' exonuclease [Mycoplasma simbae]